MKLIGKIFHFVMRHECWCFLIVFALYVGFLDGNCIWERHYVWQRTENIRQEIHNYEMRYREDSLKLSELKNNPRRLEQVARERYYMTRPDEDLFIIQEGTE